MQDHNQSNFAKTGQPCPDCGSSDALAINQDGSTKCFSCGKFSPTGGDNIVPINTAPVTKPTKGINMDGMFGPLPDRKISEATARLYGTQVRYNPDGTVAQHFYAYYKDGSLVAKKIRNVQEKSFFAEGNIRNTELFGQNKFQRGKFITITEGECDAMAAYELLGSKYPVVSVINGAASAVGDVKKNLAYFDTFDTVIIAFDNDKPGQDAAKKVAELFAPNKAKICTFATYKDANEYLKNNKREAFMNEWWAAKTFTPEGILVGADMWDVISKEDERVSVPYPYEGLNKFTYGFRENELVTITSGSGMGKSTFVKELEYHMLQATEDNIGLLHYEEDAKRTGLGLMSIEANRRLYVPDECKDVTPEQKFDFFKRTLGSGRVFLHDHFGSTNEDNLINKVRFMVKAYDVKWVIIDHLSIVVSGMEGDNERQLIDRLMTKLRTLVHETGVGMFLISHLRRPSGDRGHEQGAEVSLSQLRGSHSIAQLSDMVFSLERDQQHEDEEVRAISKLRVLKNRYVGETGIACYLKYDKTTGRMYETDDPHTEINDTDEDEF
jgi:twinkle protein